MTIYLGDNGHVELQRQGATDSSLERAAFHTAIEADDVNVDARRFSFTGASLSLITGDKVEIERIATPPENLELVEGHDFPDWLGYVHVDAIGGIRLYDDFAAAIEGAKGNALNLVRPSGRQFIKVTSQDNASRCIAQVRSYEITTQRETIDVTSLNQQYRNFYHQGLISGQGRLDCFWEHTRVDDCAEDYDLSLSEYTAYLAHLCIRLEQGASFFGRFYIYDGGTVEKSVWYEAQCIVTNVVVTVEPTQIIGTAIDFITTGPIRLMTGIPPAYLLKEEGDYILTEDGGRIQVTIDD
jgi:hypothetical protein